MVVMLSGMVVVEEVVAEVLLVAAVELVAMA
jgi:hypothetical protein